MERYVVAYNLVLLLLHSHAADPGAEKDRVVTLENGITFLQGHEVTDNIFPELRMHVTARTAADTQYLGDFGIIQAFKQNTLSDVSGGSC
jgi:hypothetical protein